MLKRIEKRGKFLRNLSEQAKYSFLNNLHFNVFWFGIFPGHVCRKQPMEPGGGQLTSAWHRREVYT